MSDYLPPGSEMHINQMPEKCLRLLFSKLPFETQFEAGDVCRQWRTVRDALFLAKKSLVIAIDNYTTSDLIITQLNKERTAFLVAMFPSLSQLTIFISNRALFYDPSQVVHLLTQYRNQLVTLKLQSEQSLLWKDIPNGSVLFDVINAMSKLKQLSLGFHLFLCQPFAPFDLPILRQLDKLDFSCQGMEKSIITQWAPHLEARSTPMEVSFDIGNSLVKYAFFDGITPKVASMFIHLPTFYCSPQQFQCFSTRFTNLTELSLVYNSDENANIASTVPDLMQALANLKQLATLRLDTGALPLNGQQPSHDRLPQLPTIKEWYLKLNDHAGRLYSHAFLSAWTASVSWFFPNLQSFNIILNSFLRCADCNFELKNNEAAKKMAKNCLCDQLRLIKQEKCSKLSEVTITYRTIIGFMPTRFFFVQCTLEDIAIPTRNSFPLFPFIPFTI